MRSLGQPYAPEHLKEMFQDPDLDYPAIRAYRKQLMEEYLERDGIQIKPGAVELLEYLKEKKMPHFASAKSGCNCRNRLYFWLFRYTPGQKLPHFYHSGRSIPQKMPPCNGSMPASSSSSALWITTPSSVYSPEVGLSSTPIIFIRVLLPEPDSPTIATNSPGHTVKSKMCDGPCRISLSEIRQSPALPQKTKKPHFQ